jgi:cyclopropane-fatty-acyl-phospholipid synthase
VVDPAFYRHVALGGSLGAAEAYMKGLWQTDDLVAVIRLFARNTIASEAMDRGWALLTWPLRKAFNLLRRNSKTGSRRNIAEHYDLGNDFFALFLDETMTYSCGIFERPDSTLQQASLAKYDRICRKLRLRATDHVAEIGTGWGGFAVHAASQYGCRVTTTTISHRQYEYARRRVAEAGLADRVRVLCRDYRDLDGAYDKLVSIEMIEAVGHEYLPAYFAACDRLLKPDGMMALQAITIPDQRYDTYRKTTDFIQRYVFPGGCLPSLGAMCDSVRKGTDLRIVHLEDFASHYARTLAQWRNRFRQQADAIRALGFDEPFLRCWEYYFGYCEVGFAERQIGVSQITLCKPDCRVEPVPGCWGC